MAGRLGLFCSPALATRLEQHGHRARSSARRVVYGGAPTERIGEDIYGVRMWPCADWINETGLLLYWAWVFFIPDP
jgi:hypothetical protein